MSWTGLLVVVALGFCAFSLFAIALAVEKIGETLKQISLRLYELRQTPREGGQHPIDRILRGEDSN